MRVFFLSLVTLSLLVAGCSAYRPDIQQGNVLEAEPIGKLTIGMTKKQVAFLLGAPLLQDPFHRDRWDYVYYLQKPEQPAIRQRLTLYFDNETLTKIDASELKLNAAKQ